MDLNRVMILGNVSNDPQSKETSGGKKFTRVSIATAHEFGEKKYTDFHTVVGWQKMAETMAKFLKKGNRVYIEGPLRTRSFVGEDGKKKFFTDILATCLILLDGKNKIKAKSDETKSENNDLEAEIEEIEMV